MMNYYLTSMLRRNSASTLLALMRYAVAAAFLCGLAGCAGQRAAGAKAAPVVMAGAPESMAVPRAYRLGALDEIEIRVKYHERLNDLAKVRPDGRITLPEVGDLYVAGLTPAELDSAVTAAYAPLVHDPEVTVFVRNFGNQTVYVFGEVKSPGMQELKPRMTVLQALASAGGPIRGAKLNSAVLLRRGPGGEAQAWLLNLDRGSIPQGRAEDAYLQAEDIVFVPKTFIATVNDFLSQIYDGLFPPFDIYFRALREYNR